MKNEWSGEAGHNFAGSTYRADIPPFSSSSSVSYLLRYTRPAMGSQFEIVIPAGLYSHSLEAALAALDTVQRLERLLSVFIEESEISIVNCEAGWQPVVVSPEVFQILEESLLISEATEGAFDITAGPLWRLWGFARKERRIPSPEEIESTLAHVGYRKVKLEHSSRTVSFTDPHVELNLGGIGKGYAIDLAAEVLLRYGVDRFLISGGYSSIRAEVSEGDSPTTAPPDGAGQTIPNPGERTPQPLPASQSVAGFWTWEVGIRDPLRPDRRVGSIRLTRGAIGTSGSAFQFFRHEGKRLSHIIDPRTGFPVGDSVLAVVVFAPNGTWADALSTAFFIHGPEWTEEFCSRNPDVGALFAVPSPEQPGYRWRSVGNWPVGAIRLQDSA